MSIEFGHDGFTVSQSVTAIKGEPLHTVTITGTDENPVIEFTCHGDRDSKCHQYPDCECENWFSDHDTEYGHLFVSHDDCWMQDWFDNDAIGPSIDVLDECGYTVGMSGTITTSPDWEYIEWEFTNE